MGFTESMVIIIAIAFASIFVVPFIYAIVMALLAAAFGMLMSFAYLTLNLILYALEKSASSVFGVFRKNK